MSTYRKMILSTLTAIVAANALTTAPALAGEEPEHMNCQRLWEDRNYIYKDAGYCFKTAKAINFFGNAGCRFDSEAALPLSAQQRSYIRTLKKWERRKGC